MQQLFSDAWKEELRRRADIVSVVSEYVHLKGRGRQLVGLCPFHNEKTPSFTVTPDVGMYHCFGCKAGGDVIRFVMDIERMEFPEAVRYLAEKVHLELPEQGERDAEAARRMRSRKEKLLDLNRRAAHYFHSLLYQPEGANVLAYLHGRGLDDPTIRAFGLGAASAAWDALLKKFLAEGETEDDLLAAGLIVRKEAGRAFDMFRDRAIFPIISEHGAVLGFGARAMGDAQPKYLNTADTVAFNKRENVYAANLLRKERQLSRILLVEGYMDVVSLTRNGVTGAVATLGTALTLEQAKYLSRKAPEVWIAYDGDAAGRKAALRALDVFAELDKPARVLAFPGGMDPDDFMKREGRAAFDALAPLSGPVFRMRCAMEGLDMSSEEGRTEYAVRAAAILRGVKQPIELENLLKKLSLETGYTREVLIQQIGVTAKEKPMYTIPTHRDKLPKEERQIFPDSFKAERALLSLMSRGVVPEGTVTPDRFADTGHRWFAEGLLAGRSPAELLDSAADDMREMCLEVCNSGVFYKEDDLMEVIADLMETMQKGTIDSRIKELTERLGAAGDGKRAILQEIAALNDEAARLRSGRKE